MASLEDEYVKMFEAQMQGCRLSSVSSVEYIQRRAWSAQQMNAHTICHLFIWFSVRPLTCRGLCFYRARDGILPVLRIAYHIALERVHVASNITRYSQVVDRLSVASGAIRRSWRAGDGDPIGWPDLAWLQSLFVITF